MKLKPPNYFSWLPRLLIETALAIAVVAGIGEPALWIVVAPLLVLRVAYLYSCSKYPKDKLHRTEYGDG